MVLLAGAAATTQASAAGVDPAFGSAGLLRYDQNPALADALDAAAALDGTVTVVGRRANPTATGGPTFNLSSNTTGLAMARYRPDGSPDATFGDGGRKTISLTLAYVNSVRFQADGSMLVAGGSTFAVRRLLADGSTDPDFTPAAVSELSAAAEAVAQPDGKIVAAGTKYGSGSGAVGLVRYDADGSLDAGFSGDGVVSTDLPGGPVENAYAVALQTDGKILLAARDGSGGMAVLRYTAAGVLDTTFSGDGIMTFSIAAGLGEAATDVLPQADGRILVVGTSGVARLTTTGDLDTTFSGDGKAGIAPLTGGASGAVDAAGRLVVAASAADGKGFGIARFTTGGDLDTAFSGDGIATTPFGNAEDTARAIVPLADGKVVAAGMGASTVAVVRYGADGTADASFSGDGRQSTAFPGLEDDANGVAVQPDAKVVAVGVAVFVPNSGDFAVARFAPDGAADPSFSGDGRVTTDFGGPDVAEAVVVQPDAKLLVTGAIRPWLPGGPHSLAVARYNPDGSLDTTFSGDGKYTASDASGEGVALQQDGKIVIAGGSSAGDGDFFVTRLNADGTLDTGFGSGGVRYVDFGNSDFAAGVAIDGDGRIVVAGTQGAGGAFAVARLTAAGDLDPSFSGDGRQTASFGAPGDAASVGGLVLGPSGTITVAGAAESATYIDFALARFTSDGALDPSFSGDGRQLTDFGGTDDRATAVVRQADGRLLVVGGAGDALGIARYLSDGSLDSSFSSDGRDTATFPGAATAGAEAVALAADGNAFLAGYVMDAVPESRDALLARWNTGGDAPGGGADTTAPTIAIASPVEGQHVAQGQQLAAQVSCTDDRPDGLASCTFPSVVDTATAGPHTFTATAADKAGNRSTGTVRYVVDAPAAVVGPPPGGAGPGAPANPGGNAPPKAGMTRAPVPPSVTLSAKVSTAAWVSGVRLALARLRPQSKLTITVRARGKTLKTVTQKAKADGRATVVIKLPKAIAKRLKRKTVQVKVQAVSADGAKVTVTKTVAVR